MLIKNDSKLINSKVIKSLKVLYFIFFFKKRTLYSIEFIIHNVLEIFRTDSVKIYQAREVTHRILSEIY